MNFDVSELTDLQNRLLKVENQNRRLKLLGVMALIAVTSLIVMAHTPSRKTVEANEFVLRDDQGNIRARLSMDAAQSNPEMTLLDEKGRARLELKGGVGSMYGGMVSVFDPRGQNRGIFSAWEAGGRISLLDSKGNPRTTLFPGDIWVAGGVRLEDDDGFAAWLGRTGLLSEGQTNPSSAASLILVDNNKKQVIWKAP
jgi:hypothetical protein